MRTWNILKLIWKIKQQKAKKIIAENHNDLNNLYTVQLLILLSVEDCRRRCWCRRYSTYDDAANGFRSTRDRVAIAKLHSLLRQRESSGFSYTFTHLWNIDFPQRTTPCRGEIIHIFVVCETCLRVVHVKATRDCHIAAT